MRPLFPAIDFGDHGLVVGVVDLPIFFLAVVDFEKEHPCDLFDSLGIAVDAGVVAHDVS